jgi:hypothetical protein
MYCTQVHMWLIVLTNGIDLTGRNALLILIGENAA